MGDDEEEQKVKGMAEAAKQAEKGLSLFKNEEEEVELDVEGATAFKAAEDAKMEALDEEIKGLGGKDNKKARTEKEKEKKAIKDSKQYIDAEKVMKGAQPKNGFFMKKKEAAAAKAAQEEAKKEEAKKEEAAKKDDKEKKEKPKKATESAGISKAERDELEKLKNDIIARKKELKEQGMSGGAINKEEQIAAWVARMNELKEKECPGSTTAKKDEKKSDKKSKLSSESQAEVESLEKEVEEYRQKLITEFKYTKKEINADPDMQDMNAKLQKLKSGKK